MKPEMTWLLGRNMKKVEKKDYMWVFVLDDGSTISTESPWRLITAKGIDVTSEDEGHSFGLPIPVNAAQRVKDAIGLKPITRFELDDKTSDLTLHFADDTAIQFLNLSCGYEGWQATHGQQLLICKGGGGVTEFSQKDDD